MYKSKHTLTSSSNERDLCWAYASDKKEWMLLNNNRMKKITRKEILTTIDVGMSQNKQFSEKKNIMKTSHSWWKNVQL